MLKKIISLNISLIFLILCIIPINAEFKPVLDLKSTAAILVDLDTGNRLFSKNPNQKIQPAQLVNIMVAIVVLEQCSDIANTSITANDSAWTELLNWGEKDKTYGLIKGGQTLTVKDYLYALMLSSSIESACVLGNYFGEGMPNFIVKMNDKAKALGCENTYFTNAHGLFDPAAYTTAADMALITQYALKNNRFTEIACTLEYEVPEYSLYWKHTNVMLFPENSKYYFAGTKGIKTGNLADVGRNLSVMADMQAGGRSYRYLVIVLAAPYETAASGTVYNHIKDTVTILNWATKHLSVTNVINIDEHLAELQVLYADTKEDFIELVPANSYSMLWNDETDVNAIEKKITINDKKLVAPVEKGTIYGKVDLILSGETIATIDLVANKSVERSAYEFNKKAALEFYKSSYWKKGVKIFIVFFIIYILLYFAALGYAHSEPNKAKQWKKSQRRKHK
ncbi:MAG: hypothetical protein LBM93_16095 [Oscillospiraceae bacterium]|jgi:D-alanyl-D-alanine carboxypeptidase|nr:hypothetical protein [Oscillospiraceae bacterium]